jgi:phosphate starvation-inducible membrane PsiE
MLGSSQSEMRLVATEERIQHQRPVLGWLLTVVGVVLSLVACVGVVWLFNLKAFSSNVRDDFERVPGFAGYALFWLGIAFFAVCFITGLLLMRARFRGGKAI